MNRFSLAAVILAFGLAGSTPGLAAESAYTDFSWDDKRCKSTFKPEGDQPEGDFVALSCPGLGKYAVLYKEGDLRASVHYGYLSKAIIDDAWESFGPFNYVAPKIEWRIGAGGKPYATIHRYFISNMNEETGAPDKAHEGQVLVISRVGQPGDKSGCVVGMVDALANPDANGLARQVADDLAAGFRCGKDTAVYHGGRGEKSADLSVYFGDAQ